MKSLMVLIVCTAGLLLASGATSPAAAHTRTYCTDAQAETVYRELLSQCPAAQSGDNGTRAMLHNSLIIALTYTNFNDRAVWEKFIADVKNPVNAPQYNAFGEAASTICLAQAHLRQISAPSNASAPNAPATPPPSGATWAEDMNKCTNATGNARIGACTAFINTGARKGAPPQIIATAADIRAQAHLDSGENDLAQRAFNYALRLNPNDALALEGLQKLEKRANNSSAPDVLRKTTTDENPQAAAKQRTPWPLPDNTQCLRTDPNAKNVFAETSVQVAVVNDCTLNLRAQACIFNQTRKQWDCFSSWLKQGEPLAARIQIRDAGGAGATSRYLKAGCSEASVRASAGGNCGGDPNGRSSFQAGK